MSEGVDNRGSVISVPLALRVLSFAAPEWGESSKVLAGLAFCEIAVKVPRVCFSGVVGGLRERKNTQT